MSSLGIETMPQEPVSEKKTRWNKGLSVFLGVLVVFFLWVVISNVYLLYFGKPLISH